MYGLSMSTDFKWKAAKNSKLTELLEPFFRNPQPILQKYPIARVFCKSGFTIEKI